MIWSLIFALLVAGPQEVLEYWFGDLAADPMGRSEIWFHGGEEVDREIESRFGRFPHRNEILGRQSTETEVLFLQEPNSSF